MGVVPEGTVFAVPLPKGGYCLGVLARGPHRTARSSHVLLGYFFGPRRQRLNEFEFPKESEGALLVCRFGGRKLVQGDWPILGRVREWSRDAWPMPTFVRRQLIEGHRIEVTYSDDDPGRLLSEVRRDGFSFEPQDGLYGSEAVELYMEGQLEMDQ